MDDICLSIAKFGSKHLPIYERALNALTIAIINYGYIICNA